jgi:crossover junction endonuclease MUS81
LVEDYSLSTRHNNIDSQALLKAMSDTQLLDGFFLKRTSSLDETIQYLTLMTRYIQSIYSTRDLCVIRDRALQYASNSIKKTRDAMKRRLSREGFVSYGIFQDLNTKSKLRTLDEVFVHQLLRIKGISPSKASAIILIYPVLRS